MVGRKLVRFVALSLLLFAGLDLGVPSLCRAESILPSPSHTDDPSIDEHGPAPASPKQGPDDCFCCCTHVRPQPITRGIGPLAELGENLLIRLPLEPELRATPLFHPPRL